jgi:hypothetical protein
VEDVNRKPTALAWKSWLFVGSAPYALGLLDLPPSLSNGPRIFGTAAVWVLCIGALISLVGLLWRVRNLQAKLNSVVIEAVGLVGVGAGLLLYAIALATSQTRNVERGSTFLAFCLCLAFTTAAVFQIHAHLKYRKDRLLPKDDGHGH